MINQKEKHVPQIRFREFKDEWIEQPIGKVLSEVKRTISLEDEKLYELITVKRRNEGVVSRGHLFGRNILVKNYSQLETGDFVISKRQVVHGATGIVAAHLNKAIVSNEYLVATENEDISTGFFNILSSLPDMKRKFLLSSYGVDIEKLFFDAEDWKKRNVIIPKKVEQVHINMYFNVLDEIIVLHQRKHDKLLMLKKAMLKKMFPKKGTLIPEIRFKGFNGNWKERDLGDIMQPISNNSLSRSYLNPIAGIAKNVHYGDVLVKFGDVIDVEKENIPFITDENIINRLASSKLIDGDIVIADAAEDLSVGKCSELFNVGKNLVFAGLHTIALRPLIKFAPTYLGYFINSNAFHDQLLPLMQGTKVLSISKVALKDTKIIFPCDLDEQRKIGSYFLHMDNLISNYSKQVDKLKKIKLACLEKMFV